MDKDIERLTALFQKLGARNPLGWASSQVSEGIPQLARFLFLRQAWRHIVPEDDHAWIDASIEASKRRPDAPYSGVGLALQRLREAGVTPEVITDLVRGMQAQFMVQLCYQLEDPGDLEAEVRNTAWGLFLLDEDDQPIEPVTGLHESVLEEQTQQAGKCDPGGCLANMPVKLSGLPVTGLACARPAASASRSLRPTLSVCLRARRSSVPGRSVPYSVRCWGRNPGRCEGPRDYGHSRTGTTGQEQSFDTGAKSRARLDRLSVSVDCASISIRNRTDIGRLNGPARR